MVDDTTEVQDEEVATHILKVHRFRENIMLDDAPFSREELQRYIKYARSIKPQFSEAAKRRYPQPRDIILQRTGGNCHVVPYRPNFKQASFFGNSLPFVKMQ